jgi:hypothetical protein
MLNGAVNTERLDKIGRGIARVDRRAIAYAYGHVPLFL